MQLVFHHTQTLIQHNRTEHGSKSGSYELISVLVKSCLMIGGFIGRDQGTEDPTSETFPHPGPLSSPPSNETGNNYTETQLTTLNSLNSKEHRGPADPRV